MASKLINAYKYLTPKERIVSGLSFGATFLILGLAIYLLTKGVEVVIIFPFLALAMFLMSLATRINSLGIRRGIELIPKEERTAEQYGQIRYLEDLSTTTNKESKLFIKTSGILLVIMVISLILLLTVAFFILE